MGKAWTHSSHEWTWGGCRGRGLLIFKQNLKANFLPIKTSGFDQVQNCSRPLEWMIQCVVFVIGPLPPRPPDIIHMMKILGPSPFFATLPKWLRIVSYAGTRVRDFSSCCSRGRVGWRAHKSVNSHQLFKVTTVLCFSSPTLYNCTHYTH